MSTIVYPLPSEDTKQSTSNGSENECKFCGKTYSSPASLRTHEKWHTGDLKHKCSFCDKKFRNPSEVRRHEMTHTGEKPHKCPNCKMKFIQKTSLKDHIEKKHKNEKIVLNMEASESADLDLLELKDFSLQEYLNQSYEKVESFSESENKSEQQNSIASSSLFSENFKVVTETIPNNNNSVVTLEPKMGVALHPQPALSSAHFELASAVAGDHGLSTDLNLNSAKIIANGNTLAVKLESDFFDLKEEKLDDISIFFEELEGQYPTLKTVDTDGVEIKEEKPDIVTPVLQTPAFPTGAASAAAVVTLTPAPGAACPPRYADVAGSSGASLHVSSVPANPPPSYHEAVTLSSSDAQTFHLIPSSSLDPGPGPSKPHTIALPAAAPGPGSQAASAQFFTGSGQSSATVSLTFQDELNEFCEGILNQIESSDWNGLSLDTAAVAGPVFSVGAVSEDRASVASVLSLAEDAAVSPASAQSAEVVDLNDPRWVSGRASLPAGWKMRTVDTSVGSRLIKKSHFLAPTGHFFDSRKSAIDHMIRTHSYSEDDIETMRKGLREKTKFEWSASRSDIPKGWKTREKLSSDGKTRIFYLSPGGISFPCRLAAYEHMVKDGGYTIADIELMKIGSKNKRNKAKDFREGDPSLPKNWKIRINAQQKESFRSPIGVFFHSRQAVLDHLIQIGAPKEDQDRVRTKIPVGGKKRRKKSSGEFKWTEGDPTCPAGWKIRIVHCADGHSVTFFLTPEGTTIKGRKAALQHMLKTGLYSQQDVDLMKEHLNVISKVSDIWTAGDPTLPVGWKIKKYKSKSDTTRVHCEYLSPQNQVFRSRKAVVEHMRKVGGYTEQDIKTVEAGNVKFKQKHGTEPIITTAAGATTSSWTESENLPKGWRMKEEGETEPRKSVFLSPEGKVFWTRYQVLEAVIKSGASQEDINIVQKGMNSAKPEAQATQGQSPSLVFHSKTESNVSHPILTKAFTQTSCKISAVQDQGLGATTSKSNPKTQAAQQSLKILEEKSVPAALKITATTKPLSTGKPTILESKKEQKSSKGSEIVWKVCMQTLPAGWKTRTLYWTDREKHFYLSPEGKIFSSRKSVLEFMEQCGTYTDNDFDKVRKGINRKRKKKTSDQWVPVKKRQKRQKKKQNKPNTASTQINLVTTKDDEESVDTSSTNDIEDDTSDEKLASIKPCTVRIENTIKTKK